MEPDLRIDQAPGGLALTGELDCQTAPLLADAVAALDGADVELDLAGITFIDSSGLATILRAMRAHPGLRMVNPTAVITRLFAVSGLEALLPPSRPASADVSCADRVRRPQ
jgi:anti-sigma B factor antagonist/stage II sporulation protein AA (anti-sigma F factor antagonist)